MRRLRGCLTALSSFDEQVIRLRGGIGGSPQTRGQVARRLDVSEGRVQSAERSGLRGLRAADREFGCASGSSSQSSRGGGPVPAWAWRSRPRDPALGKAARGGVGNTMAAAGDGANDGVRDEGGVAGVTASSDEEAPYQTVDPSAATPRGGLHRR